MLTVLRSSVVEFYQKYLLQYKSRCVCVCGFSTLPSTAEDFEYAKDD